jgi:hypothetical protein
MGVTIRAERALEREGRTWVYRLLEDDESVWWARGESVGGRLIEDPRATSLSQVANELGDEGGQWAYFVTRKLSHDLGGRLAHAGDAALSDDEHASFDASVAEADRLAAKIAMVSRDLHGSA